MLNLVKTILENEVKVRVVVKVLRDGSSLLFRDRKFVKKYETLEKCLNENNLVEFLKETVTYDEHRD